MDPIVLLIVAMFVSPFVAAWVIGRVDKRRGATRRPDQFEATGEPEAAAMLNRLTRLHTGL